GAPRGCMGRSSDRTVIKAVVNIGISPFRSWFRSARLAGVAGDYRHARASIDTRESLVRLRMAARDRMGQMGKPLAMKGRRQRALKRERRRGAPRTRIAMPIVRGVLAVLERRGKLLLIRRAAGVRAAGVWCFPGGTIEPGESEEAALAREIREELNLVVAPRQ